MCNDTERLFFKSNVHWVEGILAFVELVSNMLLATSPSDTTTTAVYNTTTGRPRRNMSAFFLYSNGSATRQAVKDRNPGMSYEEIAKQLHKQFKELSSKERQFWDERALDDMLRHNRELAAYTSSNNNSSVHTFLKIVDALLNHDGLLTSIVQWGFSGVESRSIPEEIGMFTCCVKVTTLAKVALGLLVKSALKTGDDGVGTVSITPGGKLVDTVYFRNGIGLFTREGRERLQSIGRTAITTYLHDRTCTVSSYVAGLIRKVETEGWGKVDFVLLRCLIRDVGCVDKEVITEMIGLGINASSSTFSSAGLGKILELSTYMVTRKDDTRATSEDLPRDTLVAFAVREGLIDMCLSFIEKYGKLTFFLKQHSNRSLFDHISHLLKVVHDVLLHKKTWKAIRHERHNIEDKLVSLQSDTTNNPKCKKLLDMVRSIIDMNGSYCCRCNKSLSRTEVMECNGCGRMAYCSKACQRADWLNGHSVTCYCKTYTVATAGQFQGRFVPHSSPDDERGALKLKELEVNSTMVHLKLFLDHSETILSKAKGLDIPLYDCVAVFNLSQCPPTIEVKKYTDWFDIDTPAEQKGFEETRSKDNITCIYYSQFFNGELDEDGDIPLLLQQRLFPHEWLVKQTKS